MLHPKSLPLEAPIAVPKSVEPSALKDGGHLSVHASTSTTTIGTLVSDITVSRQLSALRRPQRRGNIRLHQFCTPVAMRFGLITSSLRSQPLQSFSIILTESLYPDPYLSSAIPLRLHPMRPHMQTASPPRLKCSLLYSPEAKQASIYMVFTAVQGLWTRKGLSQRRPTFVNRLLRLTTSMTFGFLNNAQRVEEAASGNEGANSRDSGPTDGGYG
ncbi:hypothetical protein Hypma_001125 [Hypsizygus marmoreus]|uniref:Uncharacterized protein n=1 Tax=Hypsizygus marmoreus TaxID=39966 RepID=A0A369J699_HYPMA|nr:hypothetical protein Hypma_001125 [Hypsizygus marmoreus]